MRVYEKGKGGPRNFSSNAKRAIEDPELQRALLNIRRGFVEKRTKAIKALPAFDALSDRARKIKDHTLSKLDHYLEAYEQQVIASGGHCHWARTGAEAREIIAKICTDASARVITKGKSMLSEEIALNEHLEALGMEVVETDLGEYLIQLRSEPPSHIIAPAVHLNRAQIEKSFRRHHTHLAFGRPLNEIKEFVAEAREVLREKFLAADVGITGANFLVAETGSSIIVTNEGNGDLTSTLPPVHIVLASIEKIVPTLEDATVLLRVLARSATGQDMTAYTSLSTGPRREEDIDGPKAYHVVLLDNGRTDLLGTEFHEMLRCIRCGACLNHCPVYGHIGGHAYGWVYPGPMGAVLTPALQGLDEAASLPNASSFCGRCEEVCPMQIPLPKMMRHWREREFQSGKLFVTQKLSLGLWAFTAKCPPLYHTLGTFATWLLAKAARRKGSFRSLPLVSGWTKTRDFPAPQGETFHKLWQKELKKRSQGGAG